MTQLNTLVSCFRYSVATTVPSVREYTEEERRQGGPVQAGVSGYCGCRQLDVGSSTTAHYCYHLATSLTVKVTTSKYEITVFGSSSTKLSTSHAVAPVFQLLEVQIDWLTPARWSRDCQRRVGIAKKLKRVQLLIVNKTLARWHSPAAGSGSDWAAAGNITSG
ncbi:hypothetical protein J6590_019682 [Homalodisca vitripennis]|nr:hypothetical protein J6590_019682 [Homalodisca vitripennis]